MDIGIVSTRYARALMSYAEDTGCEKELYPVMGMLRYSLLHNMKLRTEIRNPILPEHERVSLICTAAYGNDKPLEQFVRFIQLVVKNGREEMLTFIAVAYRELYRMHHNISTARLITAYPVSQDKLDEIDQMTGKLLHAHMEIHPEVRPSIIGGFIFDIYNYRLDASIATQLRKVKEQFIDMNKRIV